MRKKYPYIFGVILFMALFWFFPKSDPEDNARGGSSNKSEGIRSAAGFTKREPAQTDQAGSMVADGTSQEQHASSRVAPSAVNIDQQVLLRAGSVDSAEQHPAGGKSTNLRNLLHAAGIRSAERVAGLESRRDPGTLDPEERDAGYEFLANKTPSKNTSKSDQRWLADELITTLRADGAEQPRLSHQLAAISSETGRDMILRDYALQHLGHLRVEGGGDPAAIDAALNAATGEKKGTLAGTALLALNQYSDNIGGTALVIATDSRIDLRSRLTALQVAGKQGNQDALPLAVKIARDKAQPVALRMSAIATISDLGADEHQPLLRTLNGSGDPRLRSAAGAALLTISQ